MQLDSGSGIQIPRTVGLNIPPPLQSLALQKETEPRPVAYALSLRTGAGEDSPKHRILGYWQSLVDHVDARLYHLRVDVRTQDKVNGGWPMEMLIRER